MSSAAELAQLDQETRHQSQAHRLGVLAKTGAFEVVRIDGNPANPRKYMQVSDAMFTRMTEQPGGRHFDRAGVKHGFDVCARVVRWGVAAYDAHVETGEADVQELSEILGHSYHPALTPFLKEEGDDCKDLEEVFGLLGAKPLEPLPFVIAPHPDGGERLTPSPNSWEYAQEWLQRDRPGPDLDLGRHCAAAGPVLQKIFASMIGICAVSEHLFPADIAVINDGTYVSSDRRPV